MRQRGAPGPLSVPRKQDVGSGVNAQVRKRPCGLNTSCLSRPPPTRLLFLSQESGLGFPADLPARDPAAAHHLNCPAAVAATGASPP